MATLSFVRADADGLITGVRALIQGGARRVILFPWNDVARGIAAQTADLAPDLRLAAAPGDAQSGDYSCERLAWAEAQAVVVTVFDTAGVDRALLQLVDRIGLAVVAPLTGNYYRNRPLFLITIPKSGTHLLFKLAEAFGYDYGLVLQGAPRPGSWYCIEYSNSHTVARDFFVDSVRRANFGNRHHPFASSPALFMYRNPLDILVSEANYYHQEGKTAFAGYLSGLDFTQRVERLINDRWLLGTIRERIGGFLPWLDFPNVIPVSFEELIGAEGGGSADDQINLIWSLQLKLHIPGDTMAIAGRVFDPASPTFFRGRIGACRELLNRDLLEKFAALDQDFMYTLGFRMAGAGSNMPARAGEFRHRPLVVGSDLHRQTPVALEYDFLSFNLVQMGGWIFAVPQDLGPAFDLARAAPAVLAQLPRARKLSELKRCLSAGKRPRFGAPQAAQVQRAVKDCSEAALPAAACASPGARLRRNLTRLRRMLTGWGWSLGDEDVHP